MLVEQIKEIHSMQYNFLNYMSLFIAQKFNNSNFNSQVIFQSSLRIRTKIHSLKVHEARNQKNIHIYEKNVYNIKTTLNRYTYSGY